MTAGRATAEQGLGPRYRLYSPGQVAVAALAGSPAAGAVVMALNYRRLGRPRAALLAIGIGIVATAGLVACLVEFWRAWGPVPAAIAAAAGLAVTGGLARQLQAPVARAHWARGGRQDSWGVPLGIGAAGMAVVLGLVGALEYASPAFFGNWGERFAYSPEEVIYYKGDATEDDAVRLGEALFRFGIFGSGGHKRIHLDRGAGKIVVTVVVAEGAWDAPKNVERLPLLSRTLSADVFGGQPVTVQLCNTRMQVKRVYQPGE